MRILEIDISNTRKLKAFKYRIDGENLEIAGDAATGKTTAVSALWDILEKKADSLTHGKKRGHIQITLGDSEKTIVAKRVNTKSNSTIKLSDADGKYVSIKDFKQMISELSINPHKIVEMKPKEQVATLLRAANLGDFDLEKTDERLKQLEQDRLQSSRMADKYKPGPEPEFAETVNTSELVSQVNVANEKARLYREKSQLMSDLKAEQQRLQAELDKVTARIEKGQHIVSKLAQEQVDSKPLMEKLKNAEEINAKASVYATWKTKSDQYEEYKYEHADIDQKIKIIRQQKEEALDSAQWPLKGLTIEDGEILYNDCILSNLGESEQMLVCAALAVADIEAHEIKVVRMDGVESMSKKDFKHLQKLFNEKGIQVLSTRVARELIEDGEIEIVEGEFEG